MNNALDFSGKVALITGAASGMGLAPAQAEVGAPVVLADFKEDAVKTAAQKLAAAGHRTLAVRCDVSDDVQVAAMVGPHRRRVQPARCRFQQCRRDGPSCSDHRQHPR